jgi:tetratricopeptide (TPR) repeat protein
MKTARCAWGASLAAALACCAAAQTDDTFDMLTKGQHLRAEGHFVEARTAFTALLRNAENDQTGSRLSAVALDNLAINEQDSGAYTQAETDFNQALGRFHGAKDDAIQLNVKTHLAELYIMEQRPEDAEPLLRHVAAALQNVEHPDHLALAVVYEDLAVADMTQGKFRDPETLLRQSMAFEETELGLNSLKLAGSLLTYSTMLTMEHRYADAIELAERGWQILENADQPVSKPYRASAMTVMSVIYFRAGRLAEAQSFAQQSVDLAAASLGPYHPRLAIYLDNYANVLKHADHRKEAKEVQKRADEIRDEHPGTSGYTVNVAALR